MGNLLTTLKKFFSNKNTVTILGVVAGVLVLWGFYTYRVNEATNPIRVPYAKVALNALDEITEDDIAYTTVSSDFLKNVDIYTVSASQLVGKYITTGTSVPKGGLFYKSQVVDKADLPGSFFDDIEDGFLPFPLSVTSNTLYIKQMYPGRKIDLWLKATDETGKIIYGNFVQSITVLAVLDSNGESIYELENTKNPSEIVFSVTKENYELLMKAQYLNGISIVPVPQNKNYTEAGGEVAVNDYLKNYVLSKSAVIPD